MHTHRSHEWRLRQNLLLGEPVQGTEVLHSCSTVHFGMVSFYPNHSEHSSAVKVAWKQLVFTHPLRAHIAGQRWTPVWLSRSRVGRLYGCFVICISLFISLFVCLSWPTTHVRLHHYNVSACMATLTLFTGFLMKIYLAVLGSMTCMTGCDDSIALPIP